MANRDQLEPRDAAAPSLPDGSIRPHSSPLGRPGTRSRPGNWLLNILILLVSTVLMLALCEGLLRWLDGYELFNTRLDPGHSYQQPAPGTGN